MKEMSVREWTEVLRWLEKRCRGGCWPVRQLPADGRGTATLLAQSVKGPRNVATVLENGTLAMCRLSIRAISQVEHV
jgi:hypothetical protein